MQRKRTRGYYGGTVELGSRVLPVARLRKLGMTNFMKYVVLLVIIFIVYSVYQKESKSEAWPGELERDKQGTLNPLEYENDNVVKENDDREIDRRVKQEIKRVFEEFKNKQEENKNEDREQDVFKDYNLDKVRNNQDTIIEKQQLRHENNGKELHINDDKELEGINAGGVIEQNNNANGLKVQEDGVFDINEQEDDGMFDVEDDAEKEKEELEVEKEIEQRLAEVFKDAIHEAADEVHKKQKDEIVANNQHEKPPTIDKKDDLVENVDVPEIQQVFQRKEQFNSAVRNIGNKLSPYQIQIMNEKARREALKHDDDHEFPPFVTAVRETTVKQVIQLVASVQEFFPGRKIYIYDLDLNKDTKRKVMSYCGVKMRFFMKNIFPSYVQDLDSLHWKPLVMQTALAEFGHMIWVNPLYRLTTHEFAPLIHHSHEIGILAVGQSTAYTTYAATHPDMIKFIPTNIDKLSRDPHFEIRAILIHNSPEVHENIMKVFTACAMEDSCLAPSGAKWTCHFDFTGRKPAGCHRFDESALNILLKNWFDFDTSRYAKRNNYFKRYDSSYRPTIKTCRDPVDIKDKEL